MAPMVGINPKEPAIPFRHVRNSLMVENSGLSDDLVGASKAKLKSAFGKSMKGKIESRQLLNKFVKLVA